MELLPSFFSWLFQTTWQVSVLVALVLAAQHLLRKYLSARWRFALWYLVLLRLLVPVLPESSFSLFNFVAAPERVVGTIERTVEAALPVRQALQVGPLPTNHPAGSEPAGANATRQPAKTSSPLPAKWDWRRHLFFLWLLGCTAGLVSLMRQSAASFVWERTRPPLDDPSVLDLLETCKQEIGVCRRVRVLVGPENHPPALFGLLTPTLILCQDAGRKLGPNNLRYVILHELAHVKRHDLLLKYIANLARSLHWFNPVVWYAIQRFRADQELACDELVLSYVKPGESRDYGRTIVNLSAGVLLPLRPLTAIGILENRSQLKSRIRAIADFDRSIHRLRRWAVVGVFLVGLLTLTDAQTSVRETTPRRDGKTAVSDAKLKQLESLPGPGVVAKRPPEKRPAPLRVGVIFSHLSATSDWFNEEDPYQSPLQTLQELERRGADCYAVIEPGSEDLGALPGIIADYGLGDRLVDGTDPAELMKLDVIFNDANPQMKEEVFFALSEAVQNGVGLVDIFISLDSEALRESESAPGIFGSEGLGQGTTPPPIIGELVLGDLSWITPLAEEPERVGGTPLFDPPESYDPNSSPLYVRNLGLGRVVACPLGNGHGLSISHGDFYARCVNWAAKRSAEDS